MDKFYPPLYADSLKLQVIKFISEWIGGRVDSTSGLLSIFHVRRPCQIKGLTRRKFSILIKGP